MQANDAWRPVNGAIGTEGNKGESSLLQGSNSALAQPAKRRRRAWFMHDSYGVPRKNVPAHFSPILWANGGYVAQPNCGEMEWVLFKQR